MLVPASQTLDQHLNSIGSTFRVSSRISSKQFTGAEIRTLVTAYMVYGRYYLISTDMYVGGRLSDF